MRRPQASTSRRASERIPSTSLFDSRSRIAIAAGRSPPSHASAFARSRSDLRRDSRSVESPPLPRNCAPTTATAAKAASAPSAPVSRLPEPEGAGGRGDLATGTGDEEGGGAGEGGGER